MSKKVNYGLQNVQTAENGKIAYSWTCGGIGIIGLWGLIRPEMATKTYENGGKWYIKVTPSWTCEAIAIAELLYKIDT